jgi:hypothetical protein
VVIPAYRPTEALPRLVEALLAEGFRAIVLVDDGSGPAYDAIFSRASAAAGVRLQRHGRNRGKGAALRTGIAEALEAGGVDGLITVDADGQHHPDDVARVAGAFAAKPQALILGCRNFSGAVPLRNRSGNELARAAMRRLAGLHLSDTQTGLRAIPAEFAWRLLDLTSDGYEFEFEMLLAARDSALGIVEEPIRTIYETSIASHFRPALDSAKIASVLLRHQLLVLCGPLLGLVAAAWVYGMWSGGLLNATTWYPPAIPRLMLYAGYWLACGLPLAILAPWTLAPFAAAAAVVLTAIPAGPLAVLSVALFLFSSCLLGGLVLDDDPPAALPLATCLGLGFWVLAMTLVARIPMHYAAVWWALVAAPVVFNLRRARRLLATVVRAIAHIDLRTPADRIAFAALTMVLGIEWLAVLRPESSADGLAMHLAVSTNIAAHHAFVLEPSRILWSVMPMGADWIYSIVNLMGGEMAARLVNFAMLLIVEALLYAALRPMVSRATVFLLMALFASTPLAMLVTASLFVENLCAALVLAAMTAIWRLAETGRPRYLYVAAILAGAALESKYGAIAFLLAALPAAAWAVRRQIERPARAAVAAVCLCLAAGLPPYAIAWFKTGNPLFPFSNQLFHSPLLPAGASLVDYSFREHVTPALLWNLTFLTHRYLQGQDGGLGVQYFLLVPLGILGLSLARRGRASAGWVAVAGSLAVLFATPNARYIYAALPLATVWGASGLAAMAERRPVLFRAACGLLVACLALDTWLLPVAGWNDREWRLPDPFRPYAAERLAEVSPLRVVAAGFRRAHPGERVLFTADNDLADLAGDADVYHWHELGLSEEIRRARDLPALVRIMERRKIGYFVARRLDSSGWIRPTALRELLTYCTAVESHAGDFDLRSLSPECVGQTDATLGQLVKEEPPPTSLPGWYDDLSTNLDFHGDWVRSRNFTGPYLHTTSYSDTPGSEVDFAFTGRSLTYLFTRAPNRGVAEVLIDGKLAATVDQWARGIAWQSRETLCCFAPGRHEVTIRVSGLKRAEAEGRFIDVDALVVE